MSREWITATIVVCLLACAQTSQAQSISGGLKGGITASKLPGVLEAVTFPVDEHARWGGSIGAFVTVAVSDVVAFQPEALYVMKGSTVKAEPGFAVTFDARYLEVPMFFRFGGASNRAYFLAGPSLAFLLTAEGRENSNGRTETRDFKDQLHGVDIGIAFAAGVNFNRFLMEGRWTEGLRDVDGKAVFDKASVRNRTFTILTGFRF